ncbi:hypothetical protein AYI68_g1357 [Smittium mucronatum]|uniref:Uncharacterized protein n=1 Tax=Smittium mucronatum TaxID=133383 RepID=A0A1R0H5Q3_9FUNG|nr:hypothetical protein AYI68_g1357 [Smittium mucronatum]
MGTDGLYKSLCLLGRFSNNWRIEEKMCRIFESDLFKTSGTRIQNQHGEIYNHSISFAFSSQNVHQNKGYETQDPFIQIQRPQKGCFKNLESWSDKVEMSGQLHIESKRKLRGSSTYNP